MTVASGVGGMRTMTAVRHVQTMCVRGIALAQVALGDSVVAEDKLVVILLQMRRRGISQSADVIRIVIERLEECRLHGRLLPRNFLHRLDHGRFVTRHGVVRVERDEEKFLRAFGHDLLHDFRHRRIAVAHGQVHRHIELGLQQLLLPPAGHDERRAFFGPNRRVGCGAFARPEGKNEKIEHHGAQQRIDVQDARVGEKLAKVSADIRRFGRLGRPEIEEEDGFFAHDADDGVDSCSASRNPFWMHWPAAMPPR